MNKLFKKSLAILLSALMLSGSFMCFGAFEFNEEAVKLHYGQYKNYVLLGDSVASGYRDEVSDNDADWNESQNESTYWRVPGSYADVLANTIIEDKSMTAYAAPGFRTIEMRYMMEDDYAKECDDEYLFHTSHLYVYEDMLAPDGSGEYLVPGAEYFRKDFQRAIKEADLITLGVGGNDWGAYLGWVVTDILEKENCGDKFVNMVKDLMANTEMGLDSVDELVEIAHLAGALPELLETVPSALSYGLSTFFNNWDIMIEDIYALNPDVTLMVLGMSDNSIKGKHYDYNGVEGEPVEAAEMPAIIAPAVTKIIDFIMSVGNKPMIDGAEKFGYIYVDPNGATYVDSHPDEDGHKFIANKIIECLPDPDVSKKFTDVTPGHKYYKEIEYAVLNGLMTGVTDDTFAPEEALTNGQLAAAFNKITGTDDATDGTDKVSYLSLAAGFLKAGFKGGIKGIFKGIPLAFGIISDNLLNLGDSVSRAEAAKYLKDFC